MAVSLESGPGEKGTANLFCVILAAGGILYVEKPSLETPGGCDISSEIYENILDGPEVLLVEC